MPVSFGEELQPYFRRQHELIILDDCLLWRSRIVTPPAGQSCVLDKLHDAHPGASRIKWLARSYVWWPKIDSGLERKVKSCPDCQLHHNQPATAPLHSWEWPDCPWSRLHIDFAGPCLGDKTFLIIVDAYSKWLEVLECKQTAESTITHLRQVFPTHGLLEIIVSDNGPTFVSEQFSTFLSLNGIHYTKSAPYHPVLNGLTERAVQTFKSAMKKSHIPLPVWLSQFLFCYHITPHTSTRHTPAEMLMGCQLRSRLSLMLPNASQKIYPSQNRQKQSHDQHSKMIMFYSGDAVFVCNVCNKTLAWLQGSIVSQTGHYLKRSSLTITASLVITCITSDVDLVIIQTVKTPLILLIHLRTNHLLHQIQLDQVDQWNLVHTQWVQQYLANLPESIYHLTDTHPHREGV